MVGKDGVEYAFENTSTARTARSSRREIPPVRCSRRYTRKPEPGNHVYLTIDSVLQEQTERILETACPYSTEHCPERAEGTAARRLWTFEDGLKDEITGAAAVVVNVKTGEPLAIASWPTYNVATILEDYQDLLKAENTPLFNRTLMGAYAPGSTFKTLHGNSRAHNGHRP